MYVGMYVCIFAQYSLYVNYEVKGTFSLTEQNICMKWKIIEKSGKVYFLRGRPNGRLAKKSPKRPYEEIVTHYNVMPQEISHVSWFQVNQMVMGFQKEKQ